MLIIIVIKYYANGRWLSKITNGLGIITDVFSKKEIKWILFNCGLHSKELPTKLVELIPNKFDSISTGLFENS